MTDEPQAQPSVSDVIVLRRVDVLAAGSHVQLPEQQLLTMMELAVLAVLHSVLLLVLMLLLLLLREVLRGVHVVLGRVVRAEQAAAECAPEMLMPQRAPLTFKWKFGWELSARFKPLMRGHSGGMLSPSGGVNARLARAELQMVLLRSAREKPPKLLVLKLHAPARPLGLMTVGPLSACAE